MKSLKKLLSISMIFVLFGVHIFSASAGAKTIVGEQFGRAYLSGRYLYYALDMANYSIMRYDTKTGTKTKVIGTKYKGRGTNGFYGICVKGNYIYALWDQYYGSDAGLPYIYRISKDGKQAEKLDMGNDYVIHGNRIYYTKCKKSIDKYGNIYTKSLGAASMNLDGSGKRSEKSGSIRSEKRILSDDTKKVTVSGYSYTLGNGKNKYSPKQLIRQNVKTGDKTVIYKASGSSWIGWAEIREDFVLVFVYADGKYKVYYMENDGANRILLTSGVAVG